MKKILIRIVCFLMTVSLGIGFLSSYVQAASNEIPNYSVAVSTTTELINRLNDLIYKYDKSYWTTDGKPSDSNGTTSKYYYGIQCSGFAKYIFNDLFCTGSIGSTESNNYELKNLNKAYLVAQGTIANNGIAAQKIISQALPGDFVQMKRNNEKGGPHSIIIVEVDNNGVQFFDCNSDGKCTVLNQYQTWEEFSSKNYACSVYRSEKHPDFAPAASSAITFESENVSNITKTSATISSWVSNTGQISQMGFYLGTTAESMTRVPMNTSTVEWTRFELIYDLAETYGALSPGQTYIYSFYVVNDGTEYRSTNKIFQTSGSATITYDSYSVENIADTSAEIGAWFSNPSSSTISSLGFIYGERNTSGAICNTSNIIQVTSNVSWSRSHQLYDTLSYCSLRAATSYYVRFYATSCGDTYYSDYLLFDTLAPQISFDSESISNITYNNATISIWFNNEQEKTISSLGFNFAKSNETFKKYEVTKNITWSRAHLEYSVSEYVGELQPNTTYRYQFYIVANGAVYQSGVMTFTTKAAPTYQISYNGNGGSGVPDSQTKTHNVDLILSNKTPTWDGYTFQGWATDYLSLVPDYLPGDTFTANANTTLYAVWKANSILPDNPVNIGNHFTARIMHNASGKAIESKFALTQNSLVYITGENSGAHQLWYFSRQEDGSYIISSCYDGRNLDVLNSSTENGTKVQTHIDSGHDAQRWYIYEYGGGYLIKSKLADIVLDLPDNDTTEGTTLQVYTCNGSLAQVWVIHQGNEYKLGTPVLTVSTDNTNVQFDWEPVYGATGYQIRVFQNSVDSGDEYCTIANATSGHNMELPEGSYQAYVEASHYYDNKVSNIFTFSVKHAHNYTSAITQPTCTEQGYTTYTCSICGDRHIDDYVDAIGHTNCYEVSEDPTVSKAGTIIGTCSACSYISTVLLPELNMTDYTYSVVKEPTNAEEGVGRYTWKETEYGTFYFEVSIEKTAQTEDAIVLELSTGYGTQGSIIELELRMSNLPDGGISALDLSLSYDPELVKLAETPEDGGILGDHLYGYNIALVPYGLTWNNLENFTEDGVIAKLQFEILQIPESGEIEITITCNECCDIDENIYAVSSAKGKIVKCIPGDVNGDGKVTQMDVTRLRKYLAGGWDVEINEAAADVNGDGKITQLDVTRLRKYLAGGWDVTLE